MEKMVCGKWQTDRVKGIEGNVLVLKESINKIKDELFVSSKI